MKIALVLDQLLGMAGSERVAQYICEEFAEADVYTLAYNPRTTFPYFSRRQVHTTWLNSCVRSAATFRLSFPIATRVMQSLDLRRYDLVLSCSATVAKYVSAPGRHICYCYIPTRALWHSEEYFRPSLRAAAVKPFLSYLRNRDYLAAQKVDKFIAISEISRGYIRQYYDQPADVIPCPADLELFRPICAPKDHYLLVSRLERWKKLDYAIEAFNRMRLPLRVVGTGPEDKRLKGMAARNVEFVGGLSDSALAAAYSEARAVIFTPCLEYGLIPLEANACGTPVICYGRGGVTETMIPVGGGTSENVSTAVFFYEQSAEALIEAVRKFESCHFSRAALIRHAGRWSVPEFRRKLRLAVTSFASERTMAHVLG